MVSAYTDIVNLRVAMNRGAYDFVTKPIDFDDLEATVRKTYHELEGLHEARQTREQLAEIRAELNVAAKIQQSLLPGVELNPIGVDIAAVMLPARQVSGDFYDFFPLGDTRFGFVMGDVSGKGIPAALFMAVARTVLRSTALHGADPASCLAAVNRVLVPQGAGQMYVTLFYGILDTETGRLTWTVGGHAAPWLLPAQGEARQLECPRGFMVGMFDDATFDVTEMLLRPGDTILVHTDGITDAENPQAEMFGKQRLAQLLHSIREPEVEGVITQLVDAVRDFTSGAPQADDMTLMAFAFGAPARPSRAA